MAAAADSDRAVLGQIGKQGEIADRFVAAAVRFPEVQLRNAADGDLQREAKGVRAALIAGFHIARAALRVPAPELIAVAVAAKGEKWFDAAIRVIGRSDHLERVDGRDVAVAQLIPDGQADAV